MTQTFIFEALFRSMTGTQHTSISNLLFHSCFVKQRQLINKLNGGHFKQSRNTLFYNMTKTVRGPRTKNNQSRCFISGPPRADIFSVLDRVICRMNPRNLDGQYELVEHRAVTREVVSSTPAGPTLRVFK